jgi:uncharacterized membrane protein YfcA
MAGAAGSIGEVSAGALFVPLFVALEGLSPHDAIPLSLATILGASLCAVARTAPLAHPLRPHRRLVDLDTALMLALPVTVYNALQRTLCAPAPPLSQGAEGAVLSGLAGQERDQSSSGG